MEWRSFLLRPEADTRRTLEQFKEYTLSWRRPASEEPEAHFQVWTSDAGPPSHSTPPHLVAKAAARQSMGAFSALHELLLEAYFSLNRDITKPQVLEDLWLQAGLERQAFFDAQEPALLQQVLDEHREAIEHGATGVPAVRLEGGTGVLMGAHPTEVYQRWLEQTLAEEESQPA